jgi:hypothetical protein
MSAAAIEAPPWMQNAATASRSAIATPLLAHRALAVWSVMAL